MTITVVSASYGDYDTPKPPPPGCDRAVMFTDGDAPPGWEKADHSPATLPPRWRSKGPKAAPHLYGITDDVVIWVDASLRPTGESVRALADMVPHGEYVGTFKHRWRDCILDEAVESEKLRRYAGEQIVRQARHYLEEEGHPRHGGLYETGILVWRPCTMSEAIGEAWLAEMLAWSSQDQVSFPFAVGDFGPVVLPGSSVVNAWFQWEQHKVVDW